MNRFITVQVRCAECGKPKGESNHWFVLATMSGKTYLYAVAKFDPEFPPREDNTFPVCGESCLQKLESKLLSGKTP
jgi:hypothetical protein